MSDTKKRQTYIKKIGNRGEAAALSYLQKKGYEPVERNYHSIYGEIDLIVKNSEYIVFAEVKTRNCSAIAAPAAFVTKSKQKKLLRTAALYLEEHSIDLQPSFDVVEVTYDKVTQEIIDICHIPNAFAAADGTYDIDF